MQVGKLHCTIQTVYQIGHILEEIHCTCLKQFARTDPDPIYDWFGQKIIIGLKQLCLDGVKQF